MTRLIKPKAKPELCLCSYRSGKFKNFLWEIGRKNSIFMFLCHQMNFKWLKQTLDKRQMFMSKQNLSHLQSPNIAFPSAPVSHHPSGQVFDLEKVLPFNSSPTHTCTHTGVLQQTVFIMAQENRLVSCRMQFTPTGQRKPLL